MFEIGEPSFVHFTEKSVANFLFLETCVGVDTISKLQEFKFFKNKNVYIVIVPDPDHPLRHHFNYFVYAPDSCDRPRLVSEGIHFDFDSATIEAILDYLDKEVL